MTELAAECLYCFRDMTHFKKIMPSVVLALAVVTLAGALALRPGANTGAPAGEAPAAPSSALWGLRVINSKDNRTLWTANARKAVFSRGGGTAHLTEVSIDLPAQDSKLAASGGLLNVDNYTLTLDGRVKSLVKGFDVNASSVRIVPGGRFSTGGNELVFLEKKGVKIRGRGLHANEKKKVRLDNDVKAIFY